MSNIRGIIRSDKWRPKPFIIIDDLEENIMTSTVTVTAHCAEDKEVVINVAEQSETSGSNGVYILQDGETWEDVVYDNREITVKERVQETGKVDV